MRTVAGGATFRFTITVFTAADARVTGLVNGNFTKYVDVDGSDDALSVTVTEIANGRYSVTGTAPAVTAGNEKYLHVEVTHADYAVRGFAEDFQVYNASVLAGVRQDADVADGVSVAAGGITATSIATGAIDADAIAADAVTEIQTGLATAAALTTAAASAATAAKKSTLAADILEGDEEIDKTTDATQWQQVVYTKGTSTELVRKKLWKSDGTTKVASDNDIVGERTES